MGRWSVGTGSAVGGRARPVLTLCLVASMCLMASVLVACTSPGSDPDAPSDDAPTVTREPAEAYDVVTVDDPAGAAVALSQRLFERSETVVVSAADDTDLAAADRAARSLGVPLLMPERALPAELERLDAETVLTFGDIGELENAVPVASTAEAADEAIRDLARTEPTDRDVVVLLEDAATGPAVEATARSAGVRPATVSTPDPRADTVALEALTERPEAPVVALGPGFGERLVYAAGVVREGRELPGGGHLIFPGRQVLALYGHPGTDSLGLLGEQGPRASVDRARRLAARFERAGDDPVVPAFEIIATVASNSPGRDRDFSNEAPIERLEPFVDAAERAGMFVVIDLQPGRSDFLKQVERYRSLLECPHVGLALDPEWRLARGQRHLEQIGSVSAEEVNRVSDWLAELTRSQRLPQKLFVLHQFRPSMIRDRDALELGHPELATVLHVDGQGRQAAKRGTWERLRRGAPDGLAWGWKNFLDEDEPTLTPERTQRVQPRPDLVTYQ